jgi:hypothetical protein
MAESEPAAVYHAPASAGLFASAAAVVRPNAKLIALLSIGHFVVDFNHGSLPALLPFLSAPTPLLAVGATRFLPAPRVQEVR